MIIQEQSPARVMEVRTKLYELLSHCIPPSVVLKVRLRPLPVAGPTPSVICSLSVLVVTCVLDADC